ncbi:carboxypeptidase-like regulatory domain-containing protein [Bacteroidota bacterium]
MKKYFLLLLFCFILINSQAQIKKYILNGIITDEKTGEKVANATVQINSFNIGCISNINGYFRVVLEEKPKVLYISHIAYKTKIIKDLEEYKNLEISLTPAVFEIEEAVVTAERVKNIHIAKELWAFDYEFMDDKILLVGYKKSLNNSKLILLRNWGDTICSLPFSKRIFRLKKDPLDGIYVETIDSSYQIIYYNNQIELLPAVSNEKFNESFSTCKVYNNGKLYYQYSHYHNFVTEIYWVDLRNKKKQYDLRIISDTLKINQFEREYDFFYYAKRNMELGMSVTEIDRNLQQLRESQRFDWVDSTSRFSSIYAPFMKIGNKLCLLNYFESNIELFDEDNNATDTIPIDFHKNPDWEKDYFVDEKKDKLYNLFRKNGISSLREINLSDGSQGPDIKIPEFIFVEKIKVHDGTVYFLYRDNVKEGPRMLYRMRI